ncbi:MAG: ribosome-binding factor A [Nitrospirae bacterium]|nr:ribosome-binding factor A [Nitrospirota bacterium]MCL5285575.1 ribosome-binding factor A [Nitrospirota bacterium]
MAMILSRFSREPRFSRATITRVTLSGDLRKATIFYRLFPGEDPTLCQEAFDRHLGGLRKELASRIRIKYIPTLNFLLDTGETDSERIERLLASQNSGEEGEA